MSTFARYFGSAQRSGMSSLKSHHGSAPASHSAQMYGPGRTIAQSPSSCASDRYADRSSMPSVTNESSAGMCAFHAT